MESRNPTWILVVSLLRPRRHATSTDMAYSLKNHGVDEEAEALLQVGRKTFILPNEEKLRYELGDEGGSLGYVVVVSLCNLNLTTVVLCAGSRLLEHKSSRQAVLGTRPSSSMSHRTTLLLGPTSFIALIRTSSTQT